MKALQVGAHGQGESGGRSRVPRMQSTAPSAPPLRKKSSTGFGDKIRKTPSGSRLKSPRSASKLRQVLSWDDLKQDLELHPDTSHDAGGPGSTSAVTETSVSFLSLSQLHQLEHKSKNDVEKGGWYVEAEMRPHQAPTSETRYEILYNFRSSSTVSVSMAIPLWNEQVDCLQADTKVYAREQVELWMDVKAALSRKLRAQRDIPGELVMGLTLLAQECEIKVIPAHIQASAHV
jgi:hypothetical protein